MATQTIYISGTVKWPRVTVDQMDTKFADGANDGVYHVTISPDDASLIALRSSGSRVELKTDEEGAKWVKISRKNRKTFKDKKTGVEKEEIMGPPAVIQQIDGKNVEFHERIGNGSKVTLRVSVYDSRYGKGTQLEAVRIDEHVPYVEGGATASPEYAQYAF